MLSRRSTSITLQLQDYKIRVAQDTPKLVSVETLHEQRKGLQKSIEEREATRTLQFGRLGLSRCFRIEGFMGSQL